MRIALIIGFALLFGTGCPTEFRGSSTFPDGVKGCYTRCKSHNMEMAAFVYVGDYSTACACRLKKKKRRTRDADDDSQEVAAIASQAAAAAGVEMQRQRQQQNSQQGRWKLMKKK